MTIREIIKKATKLVLANDKEESAAVILFSETQGISRSEMFVKYDDEYSDEGATAYFTLLDKYINENVPVQYIIGHTNFYGHEFNVNSDVLIPRPETAELVENVLYFYDEYFKGEDLDLVDIGTGSGCISVTLALEEKHFNVSASDISSEAIKVAKSNAKKLGADVKFYVGDMVSAVFGNTYDILVSNPPYIPVEEQVMSLVKDNEPHVALFGGEDGLMFYRVILRDAKKVLKKDKFMIAFEHADDKAKEVRDIAKMEYPNANVFTKKDMEGRDRMTFVLMGCEKDEK